MIGCAIRPRAGEAVSGDACGWWTDGGRIVLALADGLGHGPEAKLAADTALAAIARNGGLDCRGLLHGCDEQLRDTRGVALAVVVVDSARDTLTFAGVGNVRAMVLNKSGDRRLGSARGIVGALRAAPGPESLSLAIGDVLALYSDGVDEFAEVRAVVESLPGLPQGQAQRLLDRFGRAADDSAVLIYHHER